MIRSVVIDDEPFALDLVVEYVNRTPFLELTGAFSNPFKALDYLNNHEIDLIFLDINMPELSGIQLLSSLVKQPMIVFTTAYPEFAAQSYDYNALDYLLKPIKYERFLKSANKAAMQHKDKTVQETTISQIESSQTHLYIKSGSNMVKLTHDEIIFVEAAGNYLCFNTNTKRIMSLMSMKELLNLLPASHFVRIHKSFIVAINKIESVGRHEIVVAGNTIPIGITYREHFLQTIKGDFGQ